MGALSILPEFELTRLLGSGVTQSTAIAVRGQRMAGTSQGTESHSIPSVKPPKDKDIFCSHKEREQLCPSNSDCPSCLPIKERPLILPPVPFSNYFHPRNPPKPEAPRTCCISWKSSPCLSLPKVSTLSTRTTSREQTFELSSLAAEEQSWMVEEV